MATVLAWVLVVLAAAAALGIVVWSVRTANRLDRLHVRYDLSWQALDAALARRAVVARAIAADAYGEGPAARRLTAMADAAERAPRPEREGCENELSTELTLVDPAAVPPGLVAELTERSVFHLNGQQIQPDQYRFKRGGLGKSKEISHDFDWANKQVTGSDRGEAVKLTLKSGLQDKSSYQLALRNDVADGKKSMSYQVVDGDEIDVYDFRVLGEEKVRTKAGLLDAIKVERVRDPTKSGRTTVLWFAKDWSYLLVRLHQKEEDGKEYQIMLKEAEVDGKPVQGAKDS